MKNAYIQYLIFSLQKSWLAVCTLNNGEHPSSVCCIRIAIMWQGEGRVAWPDSQWGESDYGDALPAYLTQAETSIEDSEWLTSVAYWLMLTAWLV